MKWLKDIFSLVLTIVLLVLAYQYSQKSGLFTPKVHTVISRDTIVVSKIDTVVKENILVRLMKDTVIRHIYESDTVVIEKSMDSSYFSSIMFETKFEKIKVGAYAKSPVDSFIYTNFPKPVIYTDTIRIQQKPNWKERLAWGSVGMAIGVLLIRK